jgi:hypothetical protein
LIPPFVEKVTQEPQTPPSGRLIVDHTCTPPETIMPGANDFGAIWLCNCGQRWMYGSISCNDDGSVNPRWELEL